MVELSNIRTEHLTTDFEYTTDEARKWQEDPLIISEVQKMFKRVTRDKAKNLLWYLLRLQKFKASDIGTGKTIITHNHKLFNVNEKKTDGEIKVEELKRLHTEFIIKIYDITNIRRRFEDNIEDGEELTPNDAYIVKKFIPFETIRKKLCDEAGKIKFIYNFEEPDLQITNPSQEDELQHCKIQLLSTGVQFDYPLIHS